MFKVYSSILIFLFAAVTIHAQDANFSATVTQQDSVFKAELIQAKKQLHQTLLQSRNAIEINQQSNYNAYNLGNPVNIYLSTTGLQFICNANKTASILFSELIDLKLKINTIENNIQSSGFTTEYKLAIRNNIISVNKDRLHILKTILQQLLQLQKLVHENYFGMIAFKQQALAYQTKKVTAVPSEEMRKCIIQAEAQTKLYNYEKAIQLNYQIIQLHATAYPSAYFNVAILLAETNKLHSAIYNMKKFLLLHPSKEDEATAKNKIVDWEIVLNN